MKLQSKFEDEAFELGEVVDADIATMPDGRIKLQAVAKKGGIHTFFYDRLNEVCSDWQDYEESDVFYFIDRDGQIIGAEREALLRGLNSKMYDYEMAKSIGNVFETKEEAEKAVEKLKAWKRIKDKGFWKTLKDKGLSLVINYGKNADDLLTIAGDLNYTIGDETKKDLDLLFNEKEYLRKEVQKIVEKNADYYDRFGGKE